MRKRNFLKAVCLFTCLSILMLSVPGAIASERTDKKTFRLNIMEKVTMLFSFLTFLNLNVNAEKGDTPSDQTYNDDSSNDDSSQKIKATGGLLKAMLGDDN